MVTARQRAAAKRRIKLAQRRRRKPKRAKARRGRSRKKAAKHKRRSTTTARTKKSSGARSKRRATDGSNRRWSADVTRRSDALDLEQGVFKERSSARIAASLKRSAETSTRRKGTAFQSAMGMLNLYINRAGKNLPKGRRAVLERAKSELRREFGREP